MALDNATIAAKPFLQTLVGQERPTSPPVWLMRQAGRYLPEYREIRAQAGSFLNLCYNPELAAEVTLQPIRRYGFDAAILFSDILVVPDALGQLVTFQEGEGPKLQRLETPADIGKLSQAWMDQRLQPVYETVEILAGTLPPDVALIGFAGAPWTVATYMIEGGSSRDFHRVKLWAMQDPDSFQDLIDLLVSATADYLLEQIARGAETVQLFDSWAGIHSEPEFRRWVIEPAKAIVKRIRAKHQDIPIIGFPRGGSMMLEAYAAETGVTALGLDTTVPPEWAAKVLQPKLPVQGNLDPLALIAGGDVLDRMTDAVLNGLGHGRFIFNLGHGIDKSTPPDHVERLVDRIRAFRG